jgi:guanylate kinase
MIVTLTGPSCAGKSTLEEMMIGLLGFESVISTTTRTPRPDEVDGVDYYFVDAVTFAASAARGEFVESVQFSGNHYGVSVAETERIFALGKSVVVVVEPEGKKQIKEFAKQNGIKFISLFIDCPPEVIGDRFLRRFLSEISLTDPSVNDKALLTYSARFNVMLSVEAGWSINAKSTQDKYDLYIPSFDEMNAYIVMDQVLTLVMASAIHVPVRRD